MAITLVATTTVTTKVTSVTFSTLPNTATDLMVSVSPRSDQVGPYAIEIYFNGDFTAANYSWRGLRGNGASSTAATGANSFQSSYGLLMPGTSQTASTFGNAQYYIPNFNNNTAKTFFIDGVGENNGTTAYQSISYGKWTGTAAITSINVAPYTDYFDTGTIISVYAITKGSSGGVTVA